MKIRFVTNQVGVNIEYYARNQWRSAGVYGHDIVQKFGGIALFKTKALNGMYAASGCQQEVTPAGEYTSDGVTIECV